MTDTMKLQVVHRSNQTTCTLRLTIFDSDGSVADIIEGPMRHIITRAMKHVSPETKLELRKVRR